MAIDDTKIVISASDQTKAAFDSVLRGFTDMGAAGSKLTGILASIGGAIGVGLSVNALVGVVRQVTELEDSLYKMSQRTGVAVEQLSTLRYAADLSGVKLDDLDSLLVKLNKTLGQAAAGDGKAADFLKQFGIASEEVKKGLITTDEALKRISDKFANSPDGINKTTAALELFGKAGAKMISFLNTGREGIEALQTEARKLGLELATRTAQQAEAMNDQLRTLAFASEGAKIAIVNSMLPAMLGITTAMRDATVEGGKLAGVLAGLQTLMTGTDQYKNDKALTEQTEKLLKLQKNLEESTNLYGKDSGRVLMIKREIDALNGEIATTMAYRKELELQAKVEAEAAKAREAAKAGGKQLEGKSTAGDGLGREKRFTSAEIARHQAEDLIRLEKEQGDLNEYITKTQLEELKQLEEGRALMNKQVLDNIDAEAAAFDEAERTAARLGETVKNTNDIARELGLTFSSAFEDAIVGGKNFSEVLKGIEKDLVRLITRKSITEPAGKAVSGFLDGIDFGKFFGSGEGAVHLSGPDKAIGGPVAAGVSYLVGENGPEQFRPDTPGTIIPNHAMGGGGGNSVNLVQNISIDARSDAASIMLAMSRAKEMAKAEILDSMRRGGAFA